MGHWLQVRRLTQSGIVRNLKNPDDHKSGEATADDAGPFLQLLQTYLLL